jgi:hypothetical protein
VAHRRGLGLVDDPMHVAGPVTLVAVPEHPAARDGAGLGSPAEGVVGPLAGAAALEAGGQGIEDRGDLARLVGQADRGVAQVGANLDAGVLDLEDRRGRAHRVSADARQFGDDDDAEWGARLERSQGRVEAGPLFPFRARRVLIDEDVAGIHGPAPRAGVLGGAVDLSGSGAPLRGAVAVVGRLPRIDGGDSAVRAWG